MTGAGPPGSEFVFTIVVVAAILALFTSYAEVVVAATLFAGVWVLVDFLGPSLLLATVLVSLAMLVRGVTGLLPDAESDGKMCLSIEILDAVLSGRGRRSRDSADQQGRGHQGAEGDDEEP